MIDEEGVNMTPWEEIIANDMYLILYDLTPQDLETMNWVIEYTGK